MENRWNDSEVAEYKSDLALRVYTSRLLGRDSTLVLHGGGNTSVKIGMTNMLGEEEDILYVKGSGWDLATIEEPGFSPVRMKHLLGLAKRETLSDPEMVNELKTQLTNASAPAPSVEAILHAILPYKFVDHTHADAVVAITNTENGEKRIREIYGDEVVIIPYVMPGFDLAKLCAEKYPAEAGEKTIGMVLMNHGIFSFGDTAKVSYERMISLVGRAEKYLEKNKAWNLSWEKIESPKKQIRADLARLRSDVSKVSGFPMILSHHEDVKSLAFANRGDIGKISQQGPATPDHVIRTKRVPMVGKDVNEYAENYSQYFKKYASSQTILDPAPRVIIDGEIGICTLGRSINEADIVFDIYEHTMEIILRSTALGGYRALPPEDIFDVEYWDLEQAKLKKGGKPPLFSGEIVLITGAASGIGKACVDSFLSRGAAVVGIDIDKNVESNYNKKNYLGIVCDVTNDEEIMNVLEKTVRAFGGLDMLVLNAGVFPKGARIESLSTADWKRVMSVNLDANLSIMREAHPLLKLSPGTGRVVIIGSKNVPAPGPGASAYSASKAALTQLMRVAALEWGSDGIRVNTIHPNAVFDTGIWTEEVLKTRAESYGLSVDAYKTNNILRVEVRSRDVAELAAEMCGPLFAKTTGAQLPVDGGNERVI